MLTANAPIAKTLRPCVEKSVGFENLVSLFEHTHSSMQARAIRSVDIALVVRNWFFGWYIVEFIYNMEKLVRKFIFKNRELVRKTKRLREKKGCARLMMCVW